MRKDIIVVAVLLALGVLMVSCEEAQKKQSSQPPAAKKATAPAAKKPTAAKKPAKARPAPKAAAETKAKPQPSKKPQPTWDLEWKQPPEISAKEWINTPKPVTLAQFRGKKFVLLEFWWTKCPHCVVQVARMKDIYSAYAGPKLAVVTIVRDEKKNAEAFIKNNNILYPVGCDPELNTFKRYDMHMVPFAYIINPKGIVIWQGSPHYLAPDTVRDIIGFEE